MIAQRDIVLLSFPFSDLQTSKVRPAIVLSNDDQGRAAAARMPTSRFELIPDAGHAVWVDEPDRVAVIILDSLGERLDPSNIS